MTMVASLKVPWVAHSCGFGILGCAMGIVASLKVSWVANSHGFGNQVVTPGMVASLQHPWVAPQCHPSGGITQVSDGPWWGGGDTPLGGRAAPYDMEGGHQTSVGGIGDPPPRPSPSFCTYLPNVGVLPPPLIKLIRGSVAPPLSVPRPHRRVLPPPTPPHPPAPGVLSLPCPPTPPPVPPLPCSPRA